MRRISKQNRILLSTISALMIVVILGIAYAAFTGSLSINGVGVVRHSAWKIKFDNLTLYQNTGTAKELVSPEITGETTIGDYRVSLTTPGDSVAYMFNVINEGDYNAKISSISINTPTCTGKGENAVSDAEKVCSKLKYTLRYIESFDDVIVQQGDTLISQENKKMLLILTYEEFDDPSLLPTNEVEISNLGISINYDQYDNAIVDNDIGTVLDTTLMSPREKLSQNSKFFNTSITREKILSLEFKDSINIPEGYESSDCSYKQNGKVMCWWKESDTQAGYYNMYVGADGGVYAPPNSVLLFGYVGYDKMASLNLTNLNTSNVTNMYAMFYKTGYTSMTELNLGDKFDTSKVTNMAFMFYETGYTSMTKLNLGDKFDTSNVTNMKAMFYETGYTSMTKLNLGDKFDTLNVTNMQSMFNQTGYTSMTELNLGDKFDTSRVTNMRAMFYETGYTAMTSLNLGDKFDTSNVTDMQSMFSQTGYTSMTELNLGDKFDTSKVTNMYAMFVYTGYNAMTELDLGDQFNTSSVINMRQMFYHTGYNAMTELNLGSFGVNHGKVTNTQAMFYNTGFTNLNQIIVKNNDVINWLNGLDNNSIDQRIKNLLTVQN